MLSEPGFQESRLPEFLDGLGCDSETRRVVWERWMRAGEKSLMSLAPYAFHCLRVQLLFYVGMMYGVFGTRPSNIVDLEYLYYTPFAFVFCSGDKLHQQLAPLVLQEDQSFVERRDLQNALSELAAKRQHLPDAEPTEGSLIQRLWLKHWQTVPSTGEGRSFSEEELTEIMESVKPMLEALREQKWQSGPRFPVKPTTCI
jgi:hypothetical protein